MQITLNKIQTPTWQRLKVNETYIEAAMQTGEFKGDINIYGAGGVLVGKNPSIPDIQGLSPDKLEMLEYVLGHKNSALSLTIPSGVKLHEPVYADFLLNGESGNLVNFIHIKAEAGSRADVIINYKSTGDTGHFHAAFVYIEALENSEIKVVKTQFLGDKDIHADVTQTHALAGAHTQVLAFELGGRQVVSGCNTVLSGKESRGDFAGLYIGSGKKVQDFNYRMEMAGECSQGDITVRGALAGQARKTLKSTLDFVKGSYGSKAKEEEAVTALSDTAVNLSLPLLLCGEDNVQGEHATTTGRLDGEKLFYVMSRGLSMEEAKLLLLEASFAPIIGKLPSEGLRGNIISAVKEVMKNDG